MQNNRMNMSKTHMTIVELWEIAVFIRQQVPEEQDRIRAIHKKNEREAMFLVRQDMEKMGYFK